MTQSPPAGKVVLTLTSLGLPILSQKNVQKVIEKIQLPISAGIQSQQISNALNHVVSRYLASQLEIKYDQQGRKQIAEMRRNLKKYAEESTSLAHSKYPPPRLPKEWHDSAMKWFDELGGFFEKRADGGPIPKNRAEFFLMPLAAIFHVVFAL